MYCMSSKDYHAAVKWLNDRTKEYDEGHPTVSDKEWDDVYFEIQEYEHNYPEDILSYSPTQQVYFKTVSELKKVKHNHKMLSLDKAKDWDKFLNYFSNINPNKDVVGMLKLDGLTCSLQYVNGKLVSAETRGNGEVGEDITHNALVIPSIPNKINYYEPITIDGEIICKYSDFEKWRSKDYRNSRNFASGSIRLLDSKECYNRDLTFIAWNLVTPIENSFIKNLNILKDLGFNIVPYTSSFDFDAAEFLRNEAERLGYPIDGLVGRFDDVEFGTSLGFTNKYIKAAYAYKFYDEEYETELIDIIWSMGRTGQISPIALFKKINIDGTEISRASLSNISIMEQTLGKHPFKGQQIYVSKRNQIIPKIEKAKDENGEWIQ